jgi:hypothetical protein
MGKVKPPGAKRSPAITKGNGQIGAGTVILASAAVFVALLFVDELSLWLNARVFNNSEQQCELCMAYVGLAMTSLQYTNNVLKEQAGEDGQYKLNSESVFDNMCSAFMFQNFMDNYGMTDDEALYRFNFTVPFEEGAQPPNDAFISDAISTCNYFRKDTTPRNEQDESIYKITQYCFQSQNNQKHLIAAACHDTNFCSKDFLAANEKRYAKVAGAENQAGKWMDKLEEEMMKETKEIRAHL